MGPVTSMAGYLLCNGQAVSRTDYADLFEVIGTNFGVGDNSTTFNVPDYRGCFLRGLGGDSALDVYTKQPMGAPNITGNVISQEDSRSRVSGAFYRSGDSSDRPSYASNGGIVSMDASKSNSVYGAANEIRPVNYAVNFFIKY